MGAWPSIRSSPSYPEPIEPDSDRFYIVGREEIDKSRQPVDTVCGAIIQEEVARHDGVHGVKLSRNCGHQMAINKMGILFARSLTRGTCGLRNIIDQNDLKLFPKERQGWSAAGAPEDTCSLLYRGPPPTPQAGSAMRAHPYCGATCGPSKRSLQSRLPGRFVPALLRNKSTRTPT